MMVLKTLGNFWALAMRYRGTLGLVCGIAIALTGGSAYAATRAGAAPAPPSAQPILSMRSFDASGYPTNTTERFRFISQAPMMSFVNDRTAAEVTGTVTFASSNGKLMTFDFDVCYQPRAGGALTYVGGVHPKFQAPAYSWLAQTISGVVSGLPPGKYHVGLCAAQESANTMQGLGHGTVILAQTTG
jgi:hypothetical protein